ncbi:isopenicillin N synthase family dioxygenase [Streptomyces sp. YIM S03343]
MAQPIVLPVIDISRFRDPGTDRDAYLAELRAAAHDVGFLYVTGHGVPASVRAEALDTVRTFFALPEELRLELENLNSPQFHGYTRTGTEYTASSADWREQIDIGPERPALDVGPGDPDYLRLVRTNQWPSALPELRDTVLRWQAEALRVSWEVLRALAAALGQDESYFDQWFDDEAAVHVKIVHYPPRPTDDADQGVGAHKDYGCLTQVARVPVVHAAPCPPSPVLAGAARKLLIVPRPEGCALVMTGRNGGTLVWTHNSPTCTGRWIPKVLRWSRRFPDVDFTAVRCRRAPSRHRTRGGGARRGNLLQDRSAQHRRCGGRQVGGAVTPVTHWRNSVSRGPGRGMPEGLSGGVGHRPGGTTGTTGAMSCLVLVSCVCVVVAVGDSACAVPLACGPFDPAGPSSVRSPAEGCT